jgi:hypothetical protein
MNHIMRLQSELSAARAAIAATDDAIQDFREHLSGEKFRGFEADGSRKDWIAVADVLRWISVIKDAVT